MSTQELYDIITALDDRINALERRSIRNHVFWFTILSVFFAVFLSIIFNNSSQIALLNQKVTALEEELPVIAAAANIKFENGLNKPQGNFDFSRPVRIESIANPGHTLDMNLSEYYPYFFETRNTANQQFRFSRVSFANDLCEIAMVYGQKIRYLGAPAVENGEVHLHETKSAGVSFHWKLKEHPKGGFVFVSASNESLAMTQYPTGRINEDFKGGHLRLEKLDVGNDKQRFNCMFC